MPKSRRMKARCLRCRPVSRPPPLMDREARRKLLFAPISITSSGGRVWGGTAVIDQDTNTRLHTPGTDAWIRQFQTEED